MVWCRQRTFQDGLDLLPLSLTSKLSQTALFPTTTSHESTPSPCQASSHHSFTLLHVSRTKQKKMILRPILAGTRDVVPSLQLGELCSSFVRNLNLQSTQRSSRSSSDVYTDRARLHRRQSDSGVADTSVRNRYSSGKGGIYSTLSAAYSGRVKITLHLKVRSRFFILVSLCPS